MGTLPRQALLNALQKVRGGDFSVRMPGDLTGIEGKIADTFNEIVVANERMASELKRVGLAVGKKGQTSQRVRFQPLGGEWGEMEGSINGLIDDLLWPTTEVTRAVSAVAQGDLLQTVPLEIDGRPLKGEFLRSANIVNTMIQQLVIFTSEVTRVAREVGTDGKLGGQAAVRGVSGVWKDLTDGVNSMANNLTAQVRKIADVTIAVASGDLSKKITVDVRGEILQLKEAINTMVDQLRSFASEVTRVAREVGTEGRLGGQAVVPGVAGTWKDLTDSVNSMAGNLTGQVRNIAEVTTAVARGDLSRKITVDVKGEILEMKNTINTMVDQLNAFASGASGTWKDLTGNVNLLAANLTTQVRAIAEVATAVTKGDLTRSIQVDARGEVAELKDNINTMITNLRHTTDRNSEQDWLKTNLARVTGMLQGQRDLGTVGKMLLSELTPLVSAQHSLIYLMDSESEGPSLNLLASYAGGGASEHSAGGEYERLQLGEGLLGQCAVEKQRMLIGDDPKTVSPIRTGLFEAPPRNVVVLHPHDKQNVGPPARPRW